MAQRSVLPVPKQGNPPNVIVARFHYYQDCANILRLASEKQRNKMNDMSISFFPDYIAKVAKAHAAFNDIRQQLCEMEGWGLVSFTQPNSESLTKIRKKLCPPQRKPRSTILRTSRGVEQVENDFSDGVRDGWQWAFETGASTTLSLPFANLRMFAAYCLIGFALTVEDQVQSLIVQIIGKLSECSTL